MKKKRFLALLLASALTFPSISVSAAENEPTPPPEEISVEESATDAPIEEEIIIEESAEEENLIDEPVIEEPIIEQPIIEKTGTEEHVQNNIALTKGNDLMLMAQTASGTCGDDLEWALTDTGTLIILGTGDMYNWTNGTSPWYNYRLYINSIVIKNGVTNIGKYAFGGCTKLTSVTISDSVTSIEYGAFTGCQNLKTIAIPDSVTYIGNMAFEACYSLTSITLSDSMTSIEYGTFSNCTSLASITIPASVTSIGEYAFYYCRSLKKIAIPKSVTYIGPGAFYSTVLTDVYYGDSEKKWNAITIGKDNTPLLNATMHYTISGTCGDDLTWKLDLDTGTLTISGTGKMKDWPSFLTPWSSYCAQITSIVIESGVTSIGNLAFGNCKNLIEISIPKSVASIGRSAFKNCTSLTEITIPNGVTTIEESTFSDCESLTKVSIPGSVTTIGSSAFYSCTSLTEISIPDGVTSIEERTFESCESLTKISIPDSMITIDIFVFSGTSLTDVYYGGTKAQWNTISIGTSNDPLHSATIHYTYPNGECGTELTWEFNPETGTLTISGTGAMENYSSRTAPWYAYADQITNLVVKENVLSIGKYALDGCSNLKTVSIPSTLTLIDQYAFNSASQMTDVYYNGTKSEWENISKKFGNTTLNGKIIHPIMAEGIGGNTNTDVEANASISYFGNFDGTFSPDSITAMKGADAPKLVFAVDSYDDNDAADGSMFEFTVKLDNAKFIKDEKNPITVDDAISMFFITTSETNTTLASATNEFVPV